MAAASATGGGGAAAGGGGAKASVMGMGGETFRDREKQRDVRTSNIIAAKGASAVVRPGG